VNSLSRPSAAELRPRRIRFAEQLGRVTLIGRGNLRQPFDGFSARTEAARRKDLTIATIFPVFRARKIIRKRVFANFADDLRFSFNLGNRLMLRAINF
jgi:hypothetical protein